MFKSSIEALQAYTDSKADFVCGRHGVLTRSDIITELGFRTYGNYTPKSIQYKRFWYDNTESPYIIGKDEKNRVTVTKKRNTVLKYNKGVMLKRQEAVI